MTSPYPPPPPSLTALADARRASAPFLARIAAVRDGAVSPAGGDVGAHGSDRLVTRHLVHYLAALELGRLADTSERGGTAGRHGSERVVVDVGSGVGALGAWVAAELDARLHLVDPEPAPRLIAAQAFPDAAVHADVDAVPAGSADLVLAMEVIEHVAPHEQPAFVRATCELLAPGGLLVVSTPDERRYLGGWSGYAPHVGLLSFPELEALLERACGLPTQVWRLEGAPFALGPVRAVGEPLANRIWAGVQRRSPRAAAMTQAAAGALGRRLPSARGSGGMPAVRLTAEPDGLGTGLLGVVRRAPRDA